MELIVFPYESKEQMEQMIREDPKFEGFTKSVNGTLQAVSNMRVTYGVVVDTVGRTVHSVGVTSAQMTQRVALDSIRMHPEDLRGLPLLDIYIEYNGGKVEPKARAYSVYDLLDMGACRERVGAMGRFTGKYQWTEDELLDYALNEGEDGDIDWIRGHIREKEETEDPVYGVLGKYMVTHEQMEELRKNEHMTLHTDVGNGLYNVLVPNGADAFIYDITLWCDLIDVLKGVDNS